MSLLALRPGQVGGAETYLRQLISRLPDCAGGDRLILVADRDLAQSLQAPGWETVALPQAPARVIAGRILEAFSPLRDLPVERSFARLGADVVFFPQQSIYPGRIESPSVVTVVDVQHLVHPENFGAFDRLFRARVYPGSLARARHLIAISQSTRAMLVDRCAIDGKKITVIPLGIDESIDRAAIPPTALVKAPYLYYPAATYPHKNHETLLRTFAALRHRHAISEKLVLSGLRTLLWKRRLAPLCSALGIDRDVEHLGFLPFAEVQRVFAGASAIVFPSAFEGFGLPVLEAAQFGKKVMTSRLDVFGEIGVPQRWQIDFSDPEALLSALQDPSSFSLTRPPITWRNCAAQTLDVLRRAAKTR